MLTAVEAKAKSLNNNLYLQKIKKHIEDSVEKEKLCCSITFQENEFEYFNFQKFKTASSFLLTKGYLLSVEGFRSRKELNHFDIETLYFEAFILDELNRNKCISIYISWE